MNLFADLPILHVARASGADIANARVRARRGSAWTKADHRAAVREFNRIAPLDRRQLRRKKVAQ